MLVTDETSHTDRLWSMCFTLLNTPSISVISDTSHDESGPYLHVLELSIGDFFMHSKTASSSSRFVCGANAAATTAKICRHFWCDCSHTGDDKAYIVHAGFGIQRNDSTVSHSPIQELSENKGTVSRNATNFIFKICTFYTRMVWQSQFWAMMNYSFCNSSYKYSRYPFLQTKINKSHLAFTAQGVTMHQSPCMRPKPGG